MIEVLFSLQVLCCHFPQPSFFSLSSLLSRLHTTHISAICPSERLQPFSKLSFPKHLFLFHASFVKPIIFIFISYHEYIFEPPSAFLDPPVINKTIPGLFTCFTALILFHSGKCSADGRVSVGARPT